MRMDVMRMDVMRTDPVQTDSIQMDFTQNQNQKRGVDTPPCSKSRFFRIDRSQCRSGDVHQILELRRGGFLIDLLDCRELAGQSLKRRLIHLTLGI